MTPRLALRLAAMQKRRKSAAAEALAKELRLLTMRQALERLRRGPLRPFEIVYQ